MNRLRPLCFSATLIFFFLLLFCAGVDAENFSDANNASSVAAGAADAVDPEDYLDVNQSFYKDVNAFIRQEMEKAGADLNFGRYHFVLALSTSHFASDQQHALAMKKASYFIINDFCSFNDLVSCASWEMDLWDMSDTFALDKSEDSRRLVVNALPKTPMDGSQGGHDTYKTLMSIIAKIEDPQSSVIVMMTNSQESRGASVAGSKITGKNSESLKAVLRDKGYSFPADSSFPYFFEGRKNPAEVFMTIAVPKRIVSLSKDSQPRYPAFSYDSWSPSQYRPPIKILPNPMIYSPSKEIPADVSAKDSASVASDTPDSSSKDALTEGEEKKSEKRGGLNLFWIVVLSILAILAAIGAAFAKKASSGKEADKIERAGENITFIFGDENFELSVPPGAFYEMRDIGGSFKILKRGEQDSDVPEDSPIIFVLSYDLDSSAFIFETVAGNISDSKEDLGELKALGDSKFMLEKNFAASCIVVYGNDEIILSIG